MEEKCECIADGWCERYGRVMAGRRRQICRGESGLTAEQERFYREEWAKVRPATATQKVTNFAKALTQHVLTGLPMVSDEERTQRLSVCESCPHKNGDRCEVCGCVLSEKVGWAGQSCPVCVACGETKAPHKNGECQFRPKWTAIKMQGKSKCCGN